MKFLTFCFLSNSVTLIEQKLPAFKVKQPPPRFMVNSKKKINKKKIVFLFQLDVYSYGVLFCEMCTRELPVPDKRAQQIRAVKSSDYRTLINNCLRRDVEKRFDSMAVLNVVDQWMTELLRTKEST